MVRRAVALAMLLTQVVAARVCVAQDDDGAAPPDENTARQQVDALVKEFHDAKKKATPGMIQQAVNLSVSFGAPAWNAGDHAACARFYMKTADSLLAAFPDKKSATPAGRSALDDLQFALDRAHGYKDDDRSAWSLRFAFDKNQLACEMTAQRTQALIALGEQYLKRSQAQEAEDALRSAVTDLADLDGAPLDSIPVAARYAPLSLANALFAEQQFDESAAAVLKGLTYIPEWPAVSLDLRDVNGSVAEYQTYLTALETKARAEPKDASMQFLLGYQYWFTGRRPDALDCFRQTLKLDPGNAGAQLFLSPDAGKIGPPKPKA